MREHLHLVVLEGKESVLRDARDKLHKLPAYHRMPDASTMWLVVAPQTAEELRDELASEGLKILVCEARGRWATHCCSEKTLGWLNALLGEAAPAAVHAAAQPVEPVPMTDAASITMSSWRRFWRWLAATP